MSLQRARDLDRSDPLGELRGQYDIPSGTVYLDGNSLGAPLRSIPGRLAEVVSGQWAGRLIRAWPEHWWDAPVRVGERIAPLVGAAPGQVVVGDSTTVNLFKSIIAGLRIGAGRGRSELAVLGDAFPTDRYIAVSAARMMDSPITTEITERTALVLAGHVDYRTGVIADFAAITEQAHDAGAVILWDLCHSVGALPVELDAHAVDLAVGCTYKFLSGGPGAPAFVYVASALQADYDQPLTGWTGHADPFAMTEDYQAAEGVARARAGTPDMLSMLALDAALDIWDQTSIVDARAKAQQLTQFFVDCVEDLPVTVLAPDPATRGNQVSLRHPDAKDLIARLAEQDILGDFRTPDIARFGFQPLYVSFEDAWRAASALRALLST
ncbi:kynureninase [Labedaea rhizosphaerae]|uniref:Kynureninase n=1 Tax=Labedaea rhizosphaerae TaxID=598644 RepID=A0A4R6SE36_LABRH|nr:aminotransferase class V-fold PLP-dependent enzyme [Labedaea rhizosphaerae]TDQ00142.1 kynureninase [Labedaea rhizosphaerae]